MTGRDLQMARGKLVGNRRGAVKLMAEKLETPYRTYQGWEASKGLIPGVSRRAGRRSAQGSRGARRRIGLPH